MAISQDTGRRWLLSFLLSKAVPQNKKMKWNRAGAISTPGRYLGISIGDKLSGEICSRHVDGASKYLTTI